MSNAVDILSHVQTGFTSGRWVLILGKAISAEMEKQKRNQFEHIQDRENGKAEVINVNCFLENLSK